MHTCLKGDDPGELQPAQGLDGHDEEGLAEGGGEEGRGLCVLGGCVGGVGVYGWVGRIIYRSPSSVVVCGGVCVCHPND